MTKEEHNTIKLIRLWKGINSSSTLIINNRIFHMKTIQGAPIYMYRVFEKKFDKLEVIGDYDITKHDWKLKCLSKAGVLDNEVVFAYLVTKRINKEKV